MNPRFRTIFCRVNTALSRSNLPDLDYALNPYIGCIHGCTYCYARSYTRSSEISRNWGRVVCVKENLVEILERDVRKHRPGVIGLSTITDPYQPVEAIYKLTRSSLEILLKNSFRVSIQTKNSLVLRDLDILTKYSSLVDVGFTITSFRNNVVELIEPYSTNPRLRLVALEKISQRGIKTWIFYGPVIPGLNDSVEDIIDIVNAARDTNSRVLVDYLHIKSFMHEPNYPLRRFLNNISRKWWSSFLDLVMKICSEYSVECIPGFAEPVSKNRELFDFINK